VLLQEGEIVAATVELVDSTRLAEEPRPTSVAQMPRGSREFRDEISRWSSGRVAMQSREILLAKSRTGGQEFTLQLTLRAPTLPTTDQLFNLALHGFVLLV
jgi:hypothetical protein